jgi:hypothetical protein
MKATGGTGRNTSSAESIAIELARPRDQLATRASEDFQAHRRRLFHLLQEHER